MLAAAIAVEWQIEAFIRIISDLGTSGPDPDLGESGEKRVEILLRYERKVDRQAPILSVGCCDPMVPVKFLGLKRGLAIHFKGEDLIKFAFRRKRQGHRFCQHVRLPETEHGSLAASAGQFRQADCTEAEAA